MFIITYWPRVTQPNAQAKNNFFWRLSTLSKSIVLVTAFEFITKLVCFPLTTGRGGRPGERLRAPRGAWAADGHQLLNAEGTHGEQTAEILGRPVLNVHLYRQQPALERPAWLVVQGHTGSLEHLCPCEYVMTWRRNTKTFYAFVNLFTVLRATQKVYSLRNYTYFRVFQLAG
jgi:hypothetical protein